MDSKYIETAARDFFLKLEHLRQLVDSMKKEELNIREDLDQSCCELKADVERVEEKQHRIQELLRNTYDEK